MISVSPSLDGATVSLKPTDDGADHGLADKITGSGLDSEYFEVGRKGSLLGTNPLQLHSLCTKTLPNPNQGQTLPSRQESVRASSETTDSIEWIHKHFARNRVFENQRMKFPTPE